jgi:hypothetical protein
MRNDIAEADNGKEGLAPEERLLSRCSFADTVGDVLRALKVPEKKIHALMSEDPYIDCIFPSKTGFRALFERRLHNKGLPAWRGENPENSKRQHWMMTALVVTCSFIGGAIGHYLHHTSLLQVIIPPVYIAFILARGGITGRLQTLYGEDFLPDLVKPNRDLSIPPKLNSTLAANNPK